MVPEENKQKVRNDFNATFRKNQKNSVGLMKQNVNKVDTIIEKNVEIRVVPVQDKYGKINNQRFIIHRVDIKKDSIFKLSLEYQVSERAIK